MLHRLALKVKRSVGFVRNVFKKKSAERVLKTELNNEFIYTGKLMGWDTWKPIKKA